MASAHFGLHCFASTHRQIFPPISCLCIDVHTPCHPTAAMYTHPNGSPLLIHGYPVKLPPMAQTSTQMLAALPLPRHCHHWCKCVHRSQQSYFHQLLTLTMPLNACRNAATLIPPVLYSTNIKKSSTLLVIRVIKTTMKRGAKMAD